MGVDVGVKSITVRKKQYDNFHAGKYAGYDFDAHKWIDFTEWQDLIQKWQHYMPI